MRFISKSRLLCEKDVEACKNNLKFWISCNGSERNLSLAHSRLVRSIESLAETEGKRPESYEGYNESKEYLKK